MASFKASVFTHGYAMQPMFTCYPHVHMDPS